MEKNELREKIKNEFRYYLANVARSARRTNDGFNLGKTAVDSFLSFVEPQRLFDYNPDKWNHIESMYDITDNKEAKKIAEELFSDESFMERDKKESQGWRSGSLMHYVCFLNARSFFKGQIEQVRNKKTESKSSQIIFYGAPGTGKSNTIKHEVDDNKKINYRVTFHPDSDYSTFVGAYKPTMKPTGVTLASGEKEEVITYKFVPQAFTKAYTAAWNTEDDVYLIIEEINRGNCAQIFGDLFQLLDRKNGVSEYPVDTDSDLADHIRKELEKSSRTDFPNGVKEGKKLVLPSNLYIWATMNTSDQSLFPIDSAFKRRWDWQYMPIANGNKNWRIEVNGLLYDWWEFLKKINTQIGTTTNSEDKKLGYFFCKANDKLIDAKTFVGKVIFYLWNDVFKDYDLEGDLFKDEDTNKLTFDKFFSVQNGVTIINEGKVELFMKNLGVEPLEEEIIDDEEGDNESDEMNSQRNSSNIEIYYDGSKINGKSSIEKFANLIEIIDVEKVADLKIKPIKKSSYDLLSKTRLPEDTPGGYGKSLRQIGDYWLFIKYGNPRKIEMINEIADKLSLNIRAELIK